jgi:hypothetical protein
MDRIKQLFRWLQQLHARHQLRKERIVENNVMYTEEQLMARLKFFIGVSLTLTLFGIIFVVLYSLIFVQQPLNAISPIDQKFFELIVPIATFLTGTLSGIMLAGSKKEDQEAMLAAQKQAESNFEATKKAMLTPPPAPVYVAPAPVYAAPAPVTQVVMGYGGKPAPAPAYQPEI